MQTSAVLAALSAAILTLVVAAIDFAGGYSVFPLVLPFTILPAGAFPLIIAFLASCWAIVTGCILLWRRRIRSTALIAVLLCLSWLSLRYIARPAFLTGLALAVTDLFEPSRDRGGSPVVPVPYAARRLCHRTGTEESGGLRGETSMGQHQQAPLRSSCPWLRHCRSTAVCGL